MDVPYSVSVKIVIGSAECLFTVRASDFKTFAHRMAEMAALVPYWPDCAAWQGTQADIAQDVALEQALEQPSALLHVRGIDDRPDKMAQAAAQTVPGDPVCPEHKLAKPSKYKYGTVYCPVQLAPGTYCGWRGEVGAA